MSKNKKHYVDNDKFLKEMIEYKEKVKISIENQTTKPPISNFIAQSILDIANRLSTMPKFYSYPFREEMIMDAVENCIRYIDNFDPEKTSNPFAYFTQISYWAFVRRIKKEKKELYTKCKYIQHVDIFNMDDVNEKNVDKMANSGKLKISEHHQKYMEEFIQNYEK